MDSSPNNEGGDNGYSLRMRQFHPPEDIPEDTSTDRKNSLDYTGIANGFKKMNDNNLYPLINGEDNHSSTVDGPGVFYKRENGDPSLPSYPVGYRYNHDTSATNADPGSGISRRGDESANSGDNDDNDDDDDDGNGNEKKDAWLRPVPVSGARQWLSMWNIPVIVLTPILLLPIILVVDHSYQKEARCGYVICIIAIFWITEVLPISITALLPVVLFPMLGVMSARDTSGSYFNDVSMLFVGGLLVAISIEVWDLHKRIALLTVRIVGAEPKRLLLGITLVTWFMSMWISNTATTAMMMTIVQALLDQYRKVFIQRDARRAGRSTLETSGRSSTELSPASQAEYSRLCKAVSLTVAYSANIGGTGSLTGTGPNLIFFSAAQELFDSKGVKNPVTFGTWMAYALPMSLMLVMVQWLWMVVIFLRCKGWLGCWRKSQNDPDVDDMEQVNDVIRREYQKLGPVSYAQKTITVTFVLMVVAWVTRDLGGVGGWGSLFPPRTVSDSTSSTLFGLLMFVLPSFPPRMCGKGGWKGKYIQVKPLLNWRHVHAKMPWSLYLVLGGGYSIAKAATQSGLSAWLGHQLLVFQGLNIWVIVLIICYVVCMATEVTSNSATTTLMMPILAQMAISLQVNPLLFMYPAAISASFAFMLPAATPPNAIVFANGAVRVIDMMSCGVMLNVLSIPILLMATATWGNAIFHFDIFQPEFFNNITVTTTTIASP